MSARTIRKNLLQTMIVVVALLFVAIPAWSDSTDPGVDYHNTDDDGSGDGALEIQDNGTTYVWFGSATTTIGNGTTAVTVDGTLDVTDDFNVDSNGATAGGGTLAVTDTGLAVDSNGTLAGGGTLDITDTNVTISVDSNDNPADGSGSIALTETTASVTVTNSVTGQAHGLYVTESSTTITGGTTSTSLTLNDNGATFQNTTTGGPARVTGVADGINDYDAVNMKQLDERQETAYRGIAGVAALAALPDPNDDKTYSFGIGYGYFEQESAVAFGLKARPTGNVSLAAGFGWGFEDGVTANAGIGFSW